jgi:hypothetical protein
MVIFTSKGRYSVFVSVDVGFPKAKTMFALARADIETSSSVRDGIFKTHLRIQSESSYLSLNFTLNRRSLCKEATKLDREVESRVPLYI